MACDKHPIQAGHPLWRWDKIPRLELMPDWKIRDIRIKNNPFNSWQEDTTINSWSDVGRFDANQHHELWMQTRPPSSETEFCKQSPSPRGKFRASLKDVTLEHSYGFSSSDTPAIQLSMMVNSWQGMYLEHPTVKPCAIPMAELPIIEIFLNSVVGYGGGICLLDW